MSETTQSPLCLACLQYAGERPPGLRPVPRAAGPELLGRATLPAVRHVRPHLHRGLPAAAHPSVPRSVREGARWVRAVDERLQRVVARGVELLTAAALRTGRVRLS